MAFFVSVRQEYGNRFWRCRTVLIALAGCVRSRLPAAQPASRSTAQGFARVPLRGSGFSTGQGSRAPDSCPAPHRGLTATRGGLPALRGNGIVRPFRAVTLGGRCLTATRSPARSSWSRSRSRRSGLSSVRLSGRGSGARAPSIRPRKRRSGNSVWQLRRRQMRFAQQLVPVRQLA